jgi:membrane fusion protein, heavy metal efflux system
VLARMHSHDIHEARAEYQKAKSELARLKMTEAFALRVRDRAKRLLELKAGSLEQYEHAESELRNAQAAVASAEVEVDRTHLHLVEFLGIPAEASRPHTSAQHDGALELIPVRAPASGTLLARNVTPGTVVTQSMDLFVISDLSQLWAIAEVNEEHLSKLRPGMPARLYVQAYGERAFAGRIGRIGEALDPETHTVRVRIDVPNASGALKPEMYATAEIEIGGSDPALFVEPEALQEVRGATVVFVQIDDERFAVRPVQVGRTVSGMAEIGRGLNAGDRVVVRGAFIIKSEFLKASLADE